MGHWAFSSTQDLDLEVLAWPRIQSAFTSTCEVWRPSLVLEVCGGPYVGQYLAGVRLGVGCPEGAYERSRQHKVLMHWAVW